MNEIIMHKGRLAEKRQQRRQMDAVLRGQIEQLRILLDPVSGPDAIDPEQYMALSAEFAGKLADFKGLVREIEALQRVLGGA